MVSELRVPLGDTGPYVSPVQRLVDQGETVDLLVAAESLAQEVRGAR